MGAVTVTNYLNFLTNTQLIDLCNYISLVTLAGCQKTNCQQTDCQRSSHQTVDSIDGINQFSPQLLAAASITVANSIEQLTKELRDDLISTYLLLSDSDSDDSLDNSLRCQHQ